MINFSREILAEDEMKEEDLGNAGIPQEESNQFEKVFSVEIDPDRIDWDGRFSISFTQDYLFQKSRNHLLT